MTVRIGVIGTGGIGQGHIERINKYIPGAKVTAVNDVNKEVCKEVAQKYDAKFYDDPNELINSKDVDAILVASWDPTHEQFCVASIKAGKYVFCEKPLSDTVEGCQRIMDTEIAGGKRLLTVGFMRRFDKDYVELRDVIASGKIGLPLIVHAQHRNKAPTGCTHTTEMSSSGALVHEFDITRFLIGDDDEYISAQLVYPRSTRFCHEGLIDPQLVYLETKNGVRVELEIYMYCQYGYDIRCEVVGEKGTASLPTQSHTQIRTEGNLSNAIVPTWQARFNDAYVTELAKWISDVEQENITGSTAWDGYITSKVAKACNESRLTNSIVKIPITPRPEFYK
jgi:myo-inositol 2-dehydrogenase/D-chiro-inositol 1-dehydrogenase